MSVAMIALMVSSCADITNGADIKAVANIKTAYFDVSQKFKIDDKVPGKKMRLSEREVWFKENCSAKELPFFRLDQNIIDPQNARTGERITHRIEYSLCSGARNESMRGRMVTNISYMGRVIKKENINSFELKPGRWVIDTNILIPLDARFGEYSIESSFYGGQISFDDVAMFTLGP